jgi:hypothetical protein
MFFKSSADKRRRKTIFLAKEGAMTAREAIRILMLSPFYFQLAPVNRKQLVKEYCLLFSEISEKGKV